MVCHDVSTMNMAVEQTRNESRRAAILEAAQTCFFQYGLERTRMEDIARLAQISRPALYEHFENKSAIFLALADSIITSQLREAEVELQQSGPIWKRIAAAFEAWSVKPLEMIMAAPHADDIIQAGSGLAAEAYREARENFSKLLSGAFQEAARKGELNLKRAGLTATSTADLLVAASTGAKADWKDITLYRKRIAGFIRVFDTATSTTD